MPEDEKTVPEEDKGKAAAAAKEKEKEQEEAAGDFITRHVLEKDSVFFEG